MEGLPKDVLLLLLSRHCSVGDALAVAQTCSSAHRVVTDEWLDGAFELSRNALLLINKQGAGRSYRQLLNALFVAGSFFCSKNWCNTSGPYNDGTCFVETSVWVQRTAAESGERLLHVKAVSDDYGDGYRDVRVGMGTARTTLERTGEGRCCVVLRAEKADVQKSREGRLASKESGEVRIELLLSETARGPVALAVAFAGVKDTVK